MSISVSPEVQRYPRTIVYVKQLRWCKKDTASPAHAFSECELDAVSDAKGFGVAERRENHSSS